MNRKTLAGITLGLVLGLLPSLNVGQAQAQRFSSVPAGTTVQVTLDSKLSTDDVHSGDAWNGHVSQDVYANGDLVIPAGTPVSGVVTSVRQGTHTTKPSISLGLRRATVNGRSRTLYAETPAIVAGSNRARKLGAIALGTAGGAVVGGVVGGKKGAVIGGLLGGGGTYGLTRHAFRTMQLKPGTELTFTTSSHLAYRR